MSNKLPDKNLCHGGNHDFEHEPLAPGPGNVKYLSSTFPAWRKVKGAGSKYRLTLLMKISKVIITEL
jgi:hypothetical protein